MRSIRSKISAAIMTAIVTCVLVLGGIGFLTVDQLSDQLAGEKMRLTCENAQKSLDSYLESLQQSVEMVSHIAIDSLDSLTLVELGAVGVGDELPKRTAGQQRDLDAYLAEHSEQTLEAFTSVANHARGVVTYYYCMNPEVTTYKNGFFYSKVGLTSYERQPELDARTLDPDDLEHTTWYYSVMEKRRPCWVGPYKAHFLDERWTVSYVVPIYKSGTIMGVLGMDILFDTLVDQISSLEVYETGFACLLDEDGRILYHPELPMGSMPEDASRSLSMDIFKAENSGNELIRYDADGQERQLSFTTLISGRKLVVTAPVSEITSSQRNVTQLIIMASLLILGVFAVYALFLARAITGPLERLTMASRRLAMGDYDVELDEAGEDEVGALTRTFRQMSEQLGERVSDLNSRAYSDALTGVKNKGAFDAMAAEFDRAIRDDAEGATESSVEPFGLVLFDCNRLKLINDVHGHSRGDVYLKTASRVLCQVYDHSPVFRLGGDEFAVVLRGHDYEHRDELLDLFDERAAEMNAQAADPWDRVDLAKGMSVFRPGEDGDFEHVFRRADERMYEDKRQGRLRDGDVRGA